MTNAENKDSMESLPWLKTPQVRGAIVNGLFILLGVGIGLVPWIIERRADNEGASAEEKIKDLRTSALLIKCIYEGAKEIDNFDDPGVVKVRDEAPKVGRRLLNEPDDELDVSFQIIKYGYAGMLFAVAGQVEASNSEIASHAKEAEGALTRGFVLVEDVKAEARRKSVYHSNLERWLIDEDIESWILYNRAIVAALQAKSGNEPSSWGSVEPYLDKIPAAYLYRYPIKQNPALSWACENLSGAEASEYCGTYS